MRKTLRAKNALRAGAACVLLFLAAEGSATAAQAGAWAERVQVLYQAGTRSVVRRTLRVWDFQPEKHLDFSWEPAAGTVPEIAPDGTVSGAGKLVWRVRGSASYDPQTVFSTYSGHLENGMPDGRGRLESRAGEIFEGFWRNGLLDGQGVHVDEAGNRYEGAFRAGVPDGQGRLMRTTGEIFAGTFRDGRPDGDGETLLPGGTRYRSHWAGGIEDLSRRPSVLADATLGGLLRADSTGGAAGRVEIGVAVDERMNGQSDMQYTGLVRDEDIAVFPSEPLVNNAWNGTGEIGPGSGYGYYDRMDWDAAPAFLDVDLHTTDGTRVKLSKVEMKVGDSQVYRKPMFSLVQHQGCVGFRPTFSIVNHGWGNAHNMVLSVQFTGQQPDGPASPVHTMPVADFEDGTDVSIEGVLSQAGVDTGKLATDRFPCKSLDSLRVCRSKVFNDVGFGEVADYVWSDENAEPQKIFTTAVGTMDYDWSDDAGGTYHASEKFRIDIALAFVELQQTLAECGDGFGGAPEARRYQDIHLEPGKSDYAIDMPVRGNRNVSNYQTRLKIFAPMSSFHQFSIEAEFDDGSTRASKPVSLFYYHPKSVDFQSKVAPAACYLPPEAAGCG